MSNYLIKTEMITGNRRLLYFDSDDELAEILIKNGKFHGFSSCPL